MNLKSELRDPADLRLHPLQKNLPEPDKESPEWVSFVDAQSAAGPEGTPEIFITSDGRIMDGGRRWRAAKQLGWHEMLTRVRPEEDCAALIVESLLGQRNLQRCVKVYIALGLLKDFVESAEHRRLLNLKKGVKTLEKPLNGISPSNLAKSGAGRPKEENSTRALAEKFGVSDETVRRAIQVREIFEKKPDIRTEWEPKLLSGDKNLWNVLSAVGGSDPTHQNKRDAGVEQAQLEFWSSPFSSLTSALPAWEKLDHSKRDRVLKDFRKAALKMPAELREGMKEILEEIE